MTAGEDRLLEGESVTVVGLDDHRAPRPPRPARRLLRWVAAVVGLLLVVLLLLPRDESAPSFTLADGEVAPPSDERLLPWPGRGPWASDETFVTAAAQAWRDEAGEDPVVHAPGEEVVALWAGSVLGARMAVLQSVGEDDGTVHVAHVSDMLFGWRQPRLRLVGTDEVTGSPPFLVFPFVGPDDRRGQLDPDVLATFQMLPSPSVRSGDTTVLRMEGSRLVPVGLQPDGLSEPWAYGRWWIRDDPEIAVLARAEDGSLVSAVRVDPDAMVPAEPPVSLVDPAWGSDQPYDPLDYSVAAAALESLGAPSGEVAVLGSAQTPLGEVRLVEVRPSAGRPSVVVIGGDVLPETSRATVLGPATQVAVGAARTPDGDLVVVAAASPDTSLLTIDVDGRVVTTGGRTQAAVVASDVAASVVEARAFMADDTVAQVATLDVPADLTER